MKHLNKVIFAAAATLALVSCNKEAEKNNTERETVVRTVQFDAGPVTKTVFGTPENGEIPTLWTENETVGISLNFATAKKSSTPELIGGGETSETARFTADIEDSGSSPYTFYAVSPYVSIISVSSEHKSAQVNIPSAQTPLASSVDENAQILVARHNAGSTFPTNSILMNFEHLTAYAKISFSNLNLGDNESISSVSLTADKNWAGRYYYYFEDDPSDNNNKAGDLVVNSGSKTITITTTSPSNIWFACAPVDLRGETVKVVITTSTGNTYTKNITIPTDASGDKHLFKAGKVVAFTISMYGITPDGAVEYELVTDPSELTDGSEIIIAAPSNEETTKAMSTAQNGNNRGETSVTKDGNKIVSPSDAVQLFTVKAGNKANTIAFNTGSGYIYAASSNNNYLRTEETLSDNSSWGVAIDGNGLATITAQGTNTRNTIRYNSGSNIFACYASSSTTGTLVNIYKRAIPDTRDESGIAWDDDEGYGDVKDQELALPALVNPNSLTVTYSSSDPTVASVAVNAHTVTLYKEGTTEIHAIFAGNDDYKPADVYYTLEVSDTRSSVILSFVKASYELTIGTDDYNDFDGQTVTAFPSVAVTYALTGAEIGTLDESTGAITLDGSTTGTATITASFAGSATHKPAEDASYTIEVSKNGTPGDETFDLSKNTYTTGTDLVTWTGESVVITNSGTNATNYLGGCALPPKTEHLIAIEN